MLIPITRKPSESLYKLPPQLAKLGNDEIVLIELQGSLDVEGTPDGQLVGTLEIDPKTVCTPLFIYTSYITMMYWDFYLGQTDIAHWTPSSGGKDHVLNATARSSGKIRTAQTG
jgi:hypothetical protein